MTADAKKARFACLYEGEQFISNMPAVCAHCKARIVYDPEALDIAKIQYPGVKFDLMCIGCAGAKMDLTDKNIRQIRDHARAHSVLGPFADAFTDDELRRAVRNRTKQ